MTPCNHVSVERTYQNTFQNIAYQAEKITLKISAVAKAIFQALKAFFKSATRHIGAKNWSIPGVILRTPYLLIKRALAKKNPRTFSQELFGTGYHVSSQKVLSPTEVKPFFKYAAACTFISACHKSWIEPLGFTVLGSKELSNIDIKSVSPSMEIRENCLFNPKSSLKIGLLQKGDELIITFGARGSSTSELGKRTRDVDYAAVGNFLGGAPGIYKEADQVVAWLRQQPEFQNKKITLSGQSFGGSLAAYCALRQEIKAICLNPFPLGAGLQAKIPSRVLRNAEDYVTNINAKGDHYSDNKMIDAVDFIASRIGIKTPGSFGHRWSIPSAYEGHFETHAYILSSFLKHCGYDPRAKLSDIPDLHTW